jgi:hypothetical protein
MKSIVAAVALLVAAGSYVGASERAVISDPGPAAVIAQFSQAIPPEPPVVGELPGAHHATSGASCCRMTAHKDGAAGRRSAAPCGCCQKAAPATNANSK